MYRNELERLVPVIITCVPLKLHSLIISSLQLLCLDIYIYIGLLAIGFKTLIAFFSQSFSSIYSSLSHSSKHSSLSYSSIDSSLSYSSIYASLSYSSIYSSLSYSSIYASLSYSSIYFSLSYSSIYSSLSYCSIYASLSYSSIDSSLSALLHVFQFFLIFLIIYLNILQIIYCILHMLIFRCSGVTRIHTLLKYPTWSTLSEPGLSGYIQKLGTTIPLSGWKCWAARSVIV